MKPGRAVLLSLAAGLLTLFGGRAVLADLTAPTPDVRVGPIDPDRLI
ncbi:MAG TPA: hypothetical protein VEW71_09870 [Allosphingosinicella sp.]|nr:hypothetical protein [Allosphingosinicella sp.]